MLILDGCAQPAALPNTNAAAARVLDRLGITLLRANGAGCCGALSHHLSEESEALQFMRANIDAWWPHLEAGAEAIVMTASGCGVMVRDYGKLLADDPQYADKAARVAELTRDLSEVLAAEETAELPYHAVPTKVAFHSPCTLQHGQQLRGAIETLLRQAGYELTFVPDAHLCCGSAGTYSILQPGLSQQLLDNKLRALSTANPGCIATANVGCQMHLETRANVPVKHWIELIDEALA
jgi:glycolate oxidase iron-sulfur subunit